MGAKSSHSFFKRCFVLQRRFAYDYFVANAPDVDIPLVLLDFKTDIAYCDHNAGEYFARYNQDAIVHIGFIEMGLEVDDFLLQYLQLLLHQ